MGLYVTDAGINYWFHKKPIVNSFVDISPTVEFKLLYRTVSPNLCADVEKYFN